MLDVNSLERRWLKYKIKRSLPYLLSIALILILVSGILIFKSNGMDKHSSLNKPSVVTTAASTASSQPAIPVPDQQTMVLEPSMTFIQSMDTIEQDSASAPTTSAKPVNVALPKPPAISMPLPTNTVLQLPEGNEAAPQAAEAPVQKTTNASKAVTININRYETKVDIAELQKRFKETSNPNLGLFIARDAYKRGDYTEAYNYALKTNAINSHLDESWLIFAKSLVKIGKTDQAKKTLQLYISNSNSESARSLLDSIERGNFK